MTFGILFLVTIGSIYAGIFRQTEAASVGALGAILLGLIGRRLKRRELINSIEQAVLTNCMLFVIVIGANIFAYFMVQTQLPTLLVEQTRAWSLQGPVVILLDSSIVVSRWRR
jgi:C4-dicarboxylate transporter, DctM subunit